MGVETILPASGRAQKTGHVNPAVQSDPSAIFSALLDQSARSADLARADQRSRTDVRQPTPDPANPINDDQAQRPVTTRTARRDHAARSTSVDKSGADRDDDKSQADDDKSVDTADSSAARPAKPRRAKPDADDQSEASTNKSDDDETAPVADAQMTAAMRQALAAREKAAEATIAGDAGSTAATGLVVDQALQSLQSLSEKIMAALEAAQQAGETTGKDPLAALRSSDGKIDPEKMASFARSLLTGNPGLAAALGIDLDSKDTTLANLADDASSATTWQLSALGGTKLSGSGSKTSAGGNNSSFDGAGLLTLTTAFKPELAASTSNAALFAQLIHDQPAAGGGLAGSEEELAAATEAPGQNGQLINTELQRLNAAVTGKAGTAQQAAATPAQTFQSMLHTPPSDQVALHLVKAANQKLDAIEISLHPAELGQVNVQLTIAADGTVNAMVRADNQATLDLLMRDQRSLQQSLQDAGLKTTDNSLSFMLNDQGRNPNQFAQQRQSGEQNAAAPWWSRNQGDSDLTAAAALAAQVQPQRARLDDGALDIRV